MLFIFCTLANVQKHKYTINGLQNTAEMGHKYVINGTQTHEFTDRFSVINGVQPRKVGHCTLA